MNGERTPAKDLSDGVLRGIKVLDFTRAVAGGYCTRVMQDMGAEVVKIEAPEIGDGIRLLPPFSGESWALPASMSPIFIHCNAGKSSICLDLKKPEAIDLVKRMVPHFDVVVENFTPHVMGSLGLAYDDLKQLREDLIMCSISGFGADGPLADSPATDPVGQAMSGMLSLCGDENGYPYQAGNGIADSTTAMTSALAIVSAILERFRSGEGQHIDVGMMDALFAVDCAAAPSYVASHGEYSVPRGGRFHHLACPWGVFKGPQDSYMVVMAAGDLPWERLVRFMGRPELIEDPDFENMGVRLKNQEKVHEIIEEFLQTFETAEAAHRAFAEARIIVGTVLDPWQAANHPQMASRNMIHEVDYPFSDDPVATIATGLHFSKSKTSIGRAPFLGEHNRQVLREFLGLSEDELKRLHETGVLYEHVIVPHLPDAS
ncbi:MAG: CoA transferase [Deltaproteobacteria bacterium]|nr:CoA transferase [Deltaproteobacteria bacterium]